jgi:hypothetical protein
LSRPSATVRLDQIRIGNLRGGSERRTFPNHSFRPPLKNPGRPLWVTSSKTLTEHMFSELPQITDIVASSNDRYTARDLQAGNGPSPARHVRSLRGILEKICFSIINRGAGRGIGGVAVAARPPGSVL